jgi:hypothetical protein
VGHDLPGLMAGVARVEENIRRHTEDQGQGQKVPPCGPRPEPADPKLRQARDATHYGRRGGDHRPEPECAEPVIAPVGSVTGQVVTGAVLEQILKCRGRTGLARGHQQRNAHERSCPQQEHPDGGRGAGAGAHRATTPQLGAPRGREQEQGVRHGDGHLAQKVAEIEDRFAQGVTPALMHDHVPQEERTVLQGQPGVRRHQDRKGDRQARGNGETPDPFSPFVGSWGESGHLATAVVQLSSHGRLDGRAAQRAGGSLRRPLSVGSHACRGQATITRRMFLPQPRARGLPEGACSSSPGSP